MISSYLIIYANDDANCLRLGRYEDAVQLYQRDSFAWDICEFKLMRRHCSEETFPHNLLHSFEMEIGCDMHKTRWGQKVCKFFVKFRFHDTIKDSDPSLFCVQFLFIDSLCYPSSSLRTRLIHVLVIYDRLVMHQFGGRIKVVSMPSALLLRKGVSI